MSNVALRFGIEPSTIDRYFNHKKDPFDSVLNVIHSKLLDNFKAVHEETSDPFKQLELILIRHAELIRKNPSAESAQRSQLYETEQIRNLPFQFS